MKKLDLEFDESISQAANREEAETIRKGRAAEDLMESEGWRLLMEVIDEVVEELGSEIVEFPSLSWRQRMFFNPWSHFYFCEIRRALIRILRAIQQRPEMLIHDARSVLETIRLRERQSRFKRSMV